MGRVEIMGWDDYPLEVSGVHRAASPVALHSDDDLRPPTLQASGNLDLVHNGTAPSFAPIHACADPQCTGDSWI